MTTTTLDNRIGNAFRIAFGLSVFTIVYNIAEGLISIFFGFTDDSLTLFGFGADSFIETISGVGILHMVTRIQASPSSNRDDFERTALTVTGYSFYALVLVLVATSMYNIFTGQQPTASLSGVIISVVSIAVMSGLVVWKTKVGRAVHSDAILADAECTKVCIYMSVVLLVSSGLYHFVELPYIDSIGALMLAYFSFREGRECFDKAKSNSYCSCDHD